MTWKEQKSSTLSLVQCLFVGVVVRFLKIDKKKKKTGFLKYLKKRKKRLVLGVDFGVVVEVEYDDVLQLQDEVVDGHPEGRRGVEAGGFSLGVPETLAGGEKGLVYK